MALPLLPILGGLGLLYFLTRSSDEPATNINSKFAPVNVQAPPSTITAGKTYAVVLRFVGGRTAADKGDVYVEAKALSTEKGGTVGTFQVMKLLERFVPLQSGEPDLAAALRAGKKLEFIATSIQVVEM